MLLTVSQEPELCWPSGDCVVYLREPGQSSRGPAFRIHTSRLLAKGFEPLLKRCVTRPRLHAAAKGTLKGSNLPTKDLYLPAPPQAGPDAILDHHITTRNFFAWLYNIPLAGRALGPSLIDLSARVDSYRPAEKERNRNDLLSYTESQGYFDLRECVDHSLATLCLAEYLQEENLWIDAFAHCVGLGHRGLVESIEYEVRVPPSRMTTTLTHVYSMRARDPDFLYTSSAPKWTEGLTTWPSP